MRHCDDEDQTFTRSKVHQCVVVEVFAVASSRIFLDQTFIIT